MRIYKCVFSGIEVLCDNDRPLTLIHDCIYEVVGRHIEIGGEDFGLAANVEEDAEEGALAEGADNGKKKVIDQIYNYQLTETSYDKKSYMGYIKNYMKKVRDHVAATQGEEESAKFQAGAQAFVKGLLGDFDNWQFYLPSGGDDTNYEEAILILGKWDGETPKFYYWAHGMKGEKV